MAFLMSDILTTIRDLAANELEDLGSDETAQNTTIIGFVNVVLDKRVRQAYNVEISDVLNITTDGYQTFQKSGVPITDLYEPLGLYGPSGQQATKRTNYDAPQGWWRDSDNLAIHTKDMTGNHTLRYIRYPKQITSTSDTVEMPRAGKWDLIMDVVRLCKYPKNYYQEAESMGKLATGTATVKASIAAKGTNSSPPSLTDRED